MGRVLQLATVSVMIAASDRTIEITKSSMDEALEEVTRANATIREKVITILNSMTLDPLQLSFNPSKLQVARLTSSSSRKATADLSKNISAIIDATGEDVRVEDLQPSLDAPPSVAHDATIAQASSPPQESQELPRETREPMQVEEDDSRGED